LLFRTIEKAIVRDAKPAGDLNMEEMNTASAIETERKQYVAPTLTDFGSCAELTQGTFAGVGVDNGVYS
jgi:hypothetical protein